jgi:hypothetical protein
MGLPLHGLDKRIGQRGLGRIGDQDENGHRARP